MKAVRFYGAGQPLRLEEVEAPKPSARQVTVKVKAAGICHTDLHFLDGTLVPWKGSLPLTLGHEIAGEIAETGSKVSRFEEGDRVVVNNGVACGKCEYCKAGRPNLCNELDQLGFTLDGGYAEYVKVPESSLVRLPREISFEVGALLPCGVSSAYHALHDIGQVKKGETVLVNGTGGLGTSAIQIARIAGADVIAVDVVDEKLEIAKKLGANHAINGRTVDVANTVKEITKGRGVNVAIEFVGISSTMKNALSSLGKTGRYLIVGYTKDMLEASTLGLVVLEAQIRGVVAYTRDDLRAVVRLTEAGRLKPVVARRTNLDGLSTTLDMLKEGSIMGRSVAIP